MKSVKRTSHYRYCCVFLMLAMMLSMLSLMTGCGDAAEERKTVQSIDDLAGAVIGVQIGTTGDIYASDYEEEGSVIERYNKPSDAAQALVNNKIDCVVLDESPARAFAAVNPELVILEEAFVEESYAICIDKSNAKLREQINEAIAELKANGTLEKIIANYIGEETVGSYRYTSPEGIERNNGTLIAATNANFEPYEYIEGGEIVGIDIDIIHAVADILGMTVEINDIEFDSIISAVQSGKADIGISGMTVTEDRLLSIDFTDPYTTSTQVIIVNGGAQGKGLSLTERFENNFIKDERWKNITNGLLTTLIISFFSVIVGCVLGFLIAVLRSVCDALNRFKLLNLLLKFYITVIRGTPTMIQLLIIYYVIFASTSINKTLVAIIAFGLNSSAYIAEIVRAGISSIDKGQFEAGRSLGFSYRQTMQYFILPQAFKNILPALGNEFIVLIKETSISGYIGIMDLTRGGDYIRSRTYDAFMPLIAVALVYLVIVIILTYGVSKLERRLKKQ